ncbi:hypothetical protein ALC57_17212 [Trachymyrmex cornetzi]|uniref:Uncharacterized protein n=1 Tax=Trachymyrmex cornetzi TaxID=471704 RepID=A0A195DCP2_9HYME|nr:hypothetical protein ALC57_17212 [Trachymyrmex cornetzi]
MSERTSESYNLPYTRAHYRNSPDRLGSGATIRCPTEKPASHGTGFRCTRVFVRLAVEPVAYRAHRFHRGLSHVKRAAAEQVSPREKEGEKWINFRNAAGSAPTEGSAGRGSIGRTEFSRP